MILPRGNGTQHNVARDARNTPTDGVLLDRVARGDTSAFDSLFRRYHPRLRRFLERLTRQRYLIDEIFNDTMLVIWHKAGTYDGRSKASTWILGIALRRGLKAIKRSDRAGGFDCDAVQANPRAEPEELVYRNELRARLDHALQSLSPDHRAVIELTYFQGCSCREIATIVGCRVSTVKTRMFHARRRLKALLADRQEDLA